MCMQIHNELMTVTCNTVGKAKQEMDKIKHCIYEKALENEDTRHNEILQGIVDGNESMETFLISSDDES